MSSKLWTAVVVLVAVLAAPPVLRAEPMTYTDPSGDNGAWADIGRVTVELGREVVTVNYKGDTSEFDPYVFKVR